MRSRLSDTIMIKEIAAACRLSASHFVRAFRNTVGVSPYNWFLDQRIAYAKELLARTNMPLAEIALDCGFADQSHFTKTFAKRAGTTPMQWRRETSSISAFPTTRASI
ncbi:helix-turn-helix transcriptional regulator [Novosphingobium naphthalenivorans]|nr:helix-turn-helix transcriptional regulator [Novosphingobium naphthalenivorans]